MPEGKSVQSLSTELNPFCQCNEVKSFSEVRQQIINSQGTTCPKCNTRFRHVTIETRTLPISHYLCSCSGLMVLLASLFSFSPLIYIALLAYVEIHISSKADVIEDYSSMTLFIVLTVGFTFYLLFRFGQTCFDWLSELADQKISPRNVLIRLARPTLVRSTHAQAASKFEDDSSSFKLSDDIAPENRYDIVINGGGIVGFSLLAAIKRSPFLASKRVLLIEQQKPPRVKTSSEASHDRTTAEASRVFSNRVSALTTSSKQFFENLGLWSQLEPNAKLVEGMYIWSDHYQNGIHFRSDDNLVCYILENDRMMRSLVEATIQSQSILYETTVTEIEQWPERNNLPSILLKLKCNNNKTSGEEDAPQRVIQTKMLVGCDGFKSTVRAKSTLPYYEHDLQQMGIVGTLAVDSPYPANQVAFQRFVSDDLVVALLPLDESHSSLVLSIPKRSLSQWMDLNDDEFVAQLNHTIIRETKVKSQLDKLASTFNLSGEGRNPMQSKHPPTIRSVVPGSRAAFPFAFGTTVPFLVGTIQSKVPLLQALTKRDNMVNTAIIGDAAHRVHPLAGQGLNLGLGDAAQLAESLESKMAAGYELFANTEDSRESLSQALFEFERARIPKLVPMLGAIHSMQTLFAYTPSAVLPLFNSFNWIKGQIVNFANSR